MRILKHIVIHCSDSPNGVDVAPSVIDGWHQQRGFQRRPDALQRATPENAKLAHIGYHWVIRTNGQPVKGRDIDEVGAHVQGFNEHSIGICMVGRGKYFWRQFENLHFLLGAIVYSIQRNLSVPQLKYPPKGALLMQQLEKMGIKLVGHRDLSPDLDGDGVVERHEWLKECPCFDVKTLAERDFIPLPENCLDDDLHSADPKQRAIDASA
jgi:hypothetical protein